MDDLETGISEGMVYTSRWLQQQGVSRPYKDYLLRSGKLVAVAHGVYRIPGPPLKWQAIVYSLQYMGYDLTIGGLSALALHGYEHYLNLSGETKVHLYASSKMPEWLKEVSYDAEFIFHKDSMFTQRDAGLEVMPWGNWDWPILHSTPERAILEIMEDIPDKMSFVDVDMLMQGMVNVSPRRMQGLLEGCTNIKVKRLFLWFADRHRHAWYNRLEPNAISLGSGKRMIVRGGKYDRKFQITVPAEYMKFEREDEE